MTINDAKKKQKYVITTVEGQSSNRLKELGFMPGSLVTLIEKFPLKGPIAIAIRGTKFALRYEDGLNVRIKPACA